LVRADRLVRRIEGLVRSSLQLGAPSAALRRPHDPADLIEAAVEGLAPRWKRAGGVAMRPAIEPGLPRVLADEDQIVQVLSVLLNNALDAADGAAHVAVRARRAEGSAGGAAVAIDVEDGGPGIAPEVLRRVFDPFFTTKPRGTGLGLSIALRLVRENRGQIHIRPRAGGGTVVSVELPAWTP
ncbi:MAG TPA: ATP-binding protein, partial [Polyangiaceae bacterium]|nr:ATP-binding protein [Polyangiaceae bacterium]